MKKRVTLKDLATKTGLSISAVSQVLNNTPNTFTSEETRKRVRTLAEEMGYTSNYAYKLLRGKTMNMAAVMLSLHHCDEHVRELMLMLLQKFDDRGIVVSSNVFSPDAAANLRKVHELVSRGVEKFVFVGSPFGNREIEALLVKNGIPFVSTSPLFSRCVRWSVERGMIELIAGLKQRIGTNFKLVLWKYELNEPNDLLKALAASFPEVLYDELIARHVAFFDTELDRLPDRAPETLFAIGKAASAKLLRENPALAGIVFKNDYYALGAAEAATEAGRIVGKDILLSGFGNTRAAQFHPQSISSIEINLPAVTEALIEGLDTPGEFLQYLPVQVHLREKS